MAYQSQTYANNNNAYYIQGQPVINPSSVTALASPVEFLLNSTIQGAYFGSITQTPSTFILAENETASLSTINSLIMRPTVPVTQMFVSDKTNVADQPIIQQWTNTSTIVNGVFKVSNKNLNDEVNAYNITNTSQVTFQGQGALRQTTSLATNTTRFDNTGNDPFSYVEINQTLQNPSVVSRSFGGFSQMNVSSITLSTGTPNGARTDRSFLLYNTSPPNQTILGSARDVDILTGSNFLTPVSFKETGISVFTSTIFAPTVSSIVTNSALVNASTIVANVAQIPDLQNVSTIKSNTSVINATFNTNGTTQFLSTITAPAVSTILVNTSTANVSEIVNVSSINTRPIADYLVTVPTGTIISWAGNLLSGANVPPGYLLCDGSFLEIAVFPQLYAVIGLTYGGGGGQFGIPDCRGKTMMGSLTVGTESIPVGSGGQGTYAVSATFQALVTVNLPASWGGGTRVVWAISGISGQIFPGMTVVSPNVVQPFTAKVVGFINSDGLFGNRIPVNINNATLSYTYVVFDVGVGVAPTGGAGVGIQFGVTTDATGLFPYIGNRFPITQTGCGNYFNLPQDFNTPTHNHNTSGPGSQAAAGLDRLSGNFNVAGPATSNNLQSFFYTDPGTSVAQQGPAAIYNLPYNFACWQLIKYD